MTGVALELLTRARSTMSMSVGLESYPTTCFLYFMQESIAALLQNLVSSVDGIASCAQRSSFCGAELSEYCNKNGRAAWDHSATVDYAKRLLTLQFYNHLVLFLAAAAFRRPTLTGPWDGREQVAFHFPLQFFALFSHIKQPRHCIQIRQ